MLFESLAHVLPVLETNMKARINGLARADAFKRGARFVQTDTGGNRLVWIPMSDNYEPGRQQPGVKRVTRVRVAKLQAYLWGVPTKTDGTIFKRGEDVDLSNGRDSLGQVEAMLNALLCALEDSCKSVQYDLEDGAWEDTTGDSVSEYGLGYFLTLTIRIPVVYIDASATDVTSETISGVVTTTPP